MAVLDFDSFPWVTYGEAATDQFTAPLGYEYLDLGTNSNLLFGVRDGSFFNELYHRKTTTGSVFIRGVGRALLPGETATAFRVLDTFVTGDVNGIVGYFYRAGSRSISAGVQRRDNGDLRLVAGDSNASSNNFLATSSWFVPGALWRAGEPNALTLRMVSGDLILDVNNEAAALSLAMPAQLIDQPATLFGLWAVLNSSGPFYDYGIGQVVAATDFVGFYSVKLYRPAADGDTNFVPSAGADGWAMLDEAQPDGDTSYVEAANAGDRATYTYQDSNGNPFDIQPQQTVQGVKHHMSARVAGADSRYLKTVVSDGTMTETSGSAPVTGEYTDTVTVLSTNPVTGMSWQPGDFDGVLFGFQISDEA